MTVYEEYRNSQDELIKIQREARKAMDAMRPQLALAGLRLEIVIWTQVRDLLASQPVDKDRLIELLLQAETLEQAKKKSFYL